MSDWSKIIEAVKEPISLAALGLLVAMVILRQVVTKIGPIHGKSGLNLAKSVVNVVGILSLIIAISAIGYKFFALSRTASLQSQKIESNEKLELSRLAASQVKPPITRIDMETIIQKHRGSIEDCLIEEPKTMYLDFVIANGADGQLNLDILDGVAIAFASSHPVDIPAGISSREKFDPRQANLETADRSEPPEGDTYFVTGDLPAYPEVIVAKAHKMSAVAPKVNGCILDALRDSIFSFGPPKEKFIHRYISNRGVKASREFRGIFREQMDFALEEGRFSDAESVAKEARDSGYKVVVEKQIAKARKAFTEMKAGKMTQDQYREVLSGIDIDKAIQ
jgi:hypothetical protein